MKEETSINTREHGEKIKKLGRFEDEKITITTETVGNILKKLGQKKCEGPDGITLNIIRDGSSILVPIITRLFNMVLKTGRIPEVWRLAKVVPLHKKGNKSDLKNYRPISNICSLSKIYEKCLLAYIEDLEDRSGVDLTGKWQNGFKKNRGTNTAILLLQNKIAHHLEQGQFVGMYTLDLSSAFDMLDKNCFKERLERRGLPNHLKDVLVDFVSSREQYITYQGANSSIKELETGCVQGSVLGPIIFNLFISPLGEILGETAIGYADDSYYVCHSKNLGYLQRNLEKKLRKHIEWLRESGLVVNEGKTEAMIFHRNQEIQLELQAGSGKILTKKEIRILGITVTNNLKWETHIKNIVNSCKSTIFGLKTIRKYFSKEEFTNMVTAFLYSKLYYCAEVWLNNTLSSQGWNRIESIHRAAIRLIELDRFSELTRDELKELSQRATPREWSTYVEAKTLNKIIQTQEPEELYTDILCQSYTEPRFPHRLRIYDNSKNKIGQHKLVNRLPKTSKSLNFDWFEIETDIRLFQNRCKNEFFSYLVRDKQTKAKKN